jgi:maltose O-acetyltransferase
VHTVVITSNHEIGPSEERLGAWRREPVTVGAGCWVGARCLILPGVTIGDGCIVAAGSTVRDDCEPNGVYAGVPARRVRDL